MREPLPLAMIHDAVLEFLRGRRMPCCSAPMRSMPMSSEPRMTQDVDIASTRAAELAEELRVFLNQRFHIAVRVRRVREGIGYRIYQVRKPENRHLDGRAAGAILPPAQRVKKVLVVTPPELIANKVTSMVGRGHKAKGFHG